MILIVGGGFLGSYLVRHIKKTTDEKISVVIRDEKRLKYFSGVNCIKCDICFEKDLQLLIK